MWDHIWNYVNQALDIFLLDFLASAVVVGAFAPLEAHTPNLKACPSTEKQPSSIGICSASFNISHRKAQGKLYRHNPYVYPMPDDDE